MSDGLSDSFFFFGSAPRLSERRTSIFGLTSMSFVSTLASRFLRYFWQRSDICAILFQSDILAHIVFIPSGFELTSRQGFFLFNFSIFFRETTLLESNVGGPPCRGVPTAPGSLFPKKILVRQMAEIRDLQHPTFDFPRI